MKTPIESSRSETVWHLRLAYHGGAYCGWQIQPGQPTVQEELQRRLRKLFRDDTINVHATSRTDTGVHALDQNTSFKAVSFCRPPHTPVRLQRLLNRWLPADIRVTEAGLEAPDFHARYSAVAKAYTYVFELGEIHSPFSASYSWQIDTELDVEKMRRVARMLAGKHDFSGFSANPRRPMESKVREIYRCEIIEANNRLYLNVIGNGFLYKMVRSLAGFLAEAGRGQKCRPEDCQKILAAGSRPPTVKTAPPQGLFLARVFYDQQQWLDYRPVLPPFSV